MPKNKHRSHSSHRSSKRRRRSRERSRKQDCEIRSHEASREGTPIHSPHRDDLSSTLKEILAFMREQTSSKTSREAGSGISPIVETPDIYPSLGGDCEFVSPEVIPQADEQTVLENRGGEPGVFLRSSKEGTYPIASSDPVSFSATKASVSIPDPRVIFNETSQTMVEDPSSNKEDSSLMSELFGYEQSLTTDASWDPIVLEAARSEVRSGLKEEMRLSLLSKYELKGELICLEPPKVNLELRAALAKRQSVLKRDEYQSKEQLHVGACLNALGSGISDLLRLQQESTPEDGSKAAIRKLAEGIHLLADHQFHPSLTRQAFIKPCLTFVGKSAADCSSVDD